MRLFAILVTLLSSLWVLGCNSTSPYMYDAQTIGLKVSQEIGADQAAVVFYRSDLVGYPDIATITDGIDAPVIIGQLTSDAKIFYKLQPGTHYFGVYYDDIAHIIKADLKPGHYYYLKVSPNLDGIKPRFIFNDPKNFSLAEIEADMSDSTWFEPKRNLESLNERHKEFVQRQVAKGYIEWQETGKLEVSKNFNLTEPL